MSLARSSTKLPHVHTVRRGVKLEIRFCVDHRPLPSATRYLFRQFSCHSGAFPNELNPQVFDCGCRKTKQRELSAFETLFPKIEQFRYTEGAGLIDRLWQGDSFSPLCVHAITEGFPRDACFTRLTALACDLEKILGCEAGLWRPDDVMLYEYDGLSSLRPPDAVVFPRTTVDVVRIVKFVSRCGRPVG